MTRFSRFDADINNCRNLNPEQKKYLLELSDEQRRVVVDNSRYALVRSAAGSGKTRVLIAKYLYLTRVLQIPKSKILYLSYNKKNVDDTKKKMEKLHIGEDERAGFSSTFHAFALKIINHAEGAWPKLLEPVFKNWSNDEIDHDASEVFLKDFEEQLIDLTNRNKSFKQKLIKEELRTNGKLPHRYVTYLRDRNKIPGSCRSVQEKEIFEFLVKEHVDFAYEEVDTHNHSRPDFTIYLADGHRVIFEHFAVECLKEFNSVGHKRGKKYVEEKKKKIETFPKLYGEYFIYTCGANRTTEDIGKELLKKLDSFNIPYRITEPAEQTEEQTYNELLSSAVKKYKDVRNQIIETGQQISTIKDVFLKGKGYPGFFFSSVFAPLESIYSHFLDSPNIYSDFSDSLTRAYSHCNDKSKRKLLSPFKYKYVFVDEYQDISIARHNILKGIKAINPDMHLLAVGDDWQSIYSFACSDLNLFYSFKENWQYQGKKVARIFNMSTSYRVGENLLGIATRFARKDNTLSDHEVCSEPNLRTKLFYVKSPKAISNKEMREKQWEFIEKRLQQFYDKDVLILSRVNWVAQKFQKRIIDNNELSHDPKKTLACLTMHKAKGLTADIVFIQLCHKDVIPLIKKENELSEHNRLVARIRGELFNTSGYESKYNEERRLFYVALTRAKDEVYLLFEDGLESDFVKELKERSNP